MLHFSRLKAAATLLTALFICLVAVPNFFSDETVKSWPKWAQRHIVLGLDLQGGSHILLEVDSAAVRREQSQALLDDVRRVLREARVGYTGLVVRGNSVELRLREGTDVPQAMSKLNELSRPLSGILATAGQRSLEITQTGGLVRLTPTEPAILERIRQAVEQSIQIIERRVNELGTVEPLIQRQGRRPRSGAGAGLAGPDAAEGNLGQDREARFPHGGHFDSAGPAAARASVPPDSELLKNKEGGSILIKRASFRFRCAT